MVNGYETPEYRRGYDAAFSEIYMVIRSRQHPEICGGSCRICGVTRLVIEETWLALGRLMTEQEFETMAAIIARVNSRLGNE